VTLKLGLGIFKVVESGTDR